MRPLRSQRPAKSAERVHGEVLGDRSNAWEMVYSVVREIPRGRVMTYGQIATLLGSRLSARAVGWALHTCPEGVPWQRVVNASGRCSTDRLPDIPLGLQRTLLEAEGVPFSEKGTLELALYRWAPEPARPSRTKPRAGRRTERSPSSRSAKRRR